MSNTNFTELLDAGVHFGHLKRKWNPRMAPYIFMEKNGIHIIDLHKTAAKIEEAAAAMKQIAKSGKKILFVATKKQAKEIIEDKIKEVKMPFVTERWPGGMLTNFPTIRKAVKKMQSLDRNFADGTFDSISKKEKLLINREKAKLEKLLGSISDLTRMPAAIFVVDVLKENIAIREAKRLNIPVFAIVDTNSDPSEIDYVIPANDDASKSIAVIITKMAEAIQEGLDERKAEKDKMAAAKSKKAAQKKEQQEQAAKAKSKAKTDAKEEKPKPKAEKVDIKGQAENKTEGEGKPGTTAKKSAAKKSPAKKSDSN